MSLEDGDQPLVSDDITLACIHKMHFLRFDNSDA